jgi:multimeric flavodoxin WrbA
MKIVLLNGSPKKNGNTAQILKIAAKATGATAKDITLLNLAEYDIKPCNACGVCWKRQKCPIKDDLENVLKPILEADGIILGSPVYYGTISPELKAFIDRSGELLGARGFPLKGKIGGAFAVARRWGHITTWTTMLLYLTAMRMIIPGAGWSAATALAPGDVLKDKEGVGLAKELGMAMGELAKKLKL